MFTNLNEIVPFPYILRNAELVYWKSVPGSNDV